MRTAYCGAAVAASTTTLKAKALSTMEGELGGTSRVLTRTEYGRIVARALGVPPEGATFIGTDNLAHLLVATHKGSARVSGQRSWGSPGRPSTYGTGASAMPHATKAFCQKSGTSPSRTARKSHAESLREQ